MLYDCPPPPGGSSSWFLSAHGLKGQGEPGFNPRWLLDGVVAARRAILNPVTRVCLLSDRPLHTEMKATIEDLLRRASLCFDKVQLLPVSTALEPAMFKALAVQSWISSEPSIQKVFLYETDAGTCSQVKSAVLRSKRAFVAPGDAASLAATR